MTRVGILAVTDQASTMISTKPSTQIWTILIACRFAFKITVSSFFRTRQGVYG